MYLHIFVQKCRVSQIASNGAGKILVTWMVPYFAVRPSHFHLHLSTFDVRQLRRRRDHDLESIHEEGDVRAGDGCHRFHP